MNNHVMKAAGRYENLLSEIESEGRQPTTEERAELYDLLLEVDQADGEAPKPRIQLEAHRNRIQPPNDSICYRDPKTNKLVRAVSHGESLADSTDSRSSAHPAEFGEWLRAELLGQPQSQASLQVQKDASGGFLVPELMATSVLDYARNRQVTSLAGVRTMVLPAAKEFTFATVESDPTAYWRREAVAITASEPTFGEINMRPRTLACLVPITVELLEDAANSASAITNAIGGAIAVALDTAVLNGAGASEPTGIINWTNVNTTAVGGTFDYDNLISAQEDIMQANGPDNPSAFILPPDLEVYRRQLKDGDGQYMRQSDTPVGNVPFLPTMSCPSGYIVTGAFDQVVLGMRTELKMETLDAGTANDADGNSFNATTQLGKWLRCYLRCDVAVMRPTWLATLSGVTTS